jgi:guanylate kinase
MPCSTQRGLLAVLSGPSGVGKTTIVREVLRRLGGTFSVSATTRGPAANEQEGKDYFFVTEEKFKQMIAADEFLEYACVFGKTWYGTPRKPVVEQLQCGELVILDIDVQGGQQVKARMPEALTIFIEPPNEEELLRRLRSRKREDDATIERRFKEAKVEMAAARSSGAYDEFIVNDDLDLAISAICSLIERRRKAVNAC